MKKRSRFYIWQARILSNSERLTDVVPSIFRHLSWFSLLMDTLVRLAHYISPDILLPLATSSGSSRGLPRLYGICFPSSAFWVCFQLASAWNTITGFPVSFSRKEEHFQPQAPRPDTITPEPLVYTIKFMAVRKDLDYRCNTMQIHLS